MRALANPVEVGIAYPTPTPTGVYKLMVVVWAGLLN